METYILDGAKQVLHNVEYNTVCKDLERLYIVVYQEKISIPFLAIHLCQSAIVIIARSLLKYIHLHKNQLD